MQGYPLGCWAWRTDAAAQSQQEWSSRSQRAFIGAATIVLSYLAAIAVEMRFGQGGDTVIHLMMGTGFVIFARSVFDFGLPRWVNMIGAAAAATFGAIFLLQGVSDLTHLRDSGSSAFDVFGHELERLLPDVVYLWFLALLIGSSQGKARRRGFLVMLVIFGLEIATLVSLLIGAPMATVKVLVLLPFGWLLFDSAERRTIQSIDPRDELRPAANSAAH